MKTASCTTHTRLETVARRILLAICWINGISAPICGILMIASPGGELMMMVSLLTEMQTWPAAELFFRDLTWPGIALLLVNGVPNLVCLTLWFKKKPLYAPAGIVCGTLLVLWCTWELVFIPNAVTIGYLIVGMIQVATAAYCMHAARVTLANPLLRDV